MAGSKKKEAGKTTKKVEAKVQELHIIVAKEKNYTRYLDASTSESWTKSALALLSERFSSGDYYYDPLDEDDEYAQTTKKEREALFAISKATLADLPHSVMVDLEKKIEEARRDVLAEAEDHELYLQIKAVVESQDMSWVGTGNYSRPKAWALLERRSEGEYEGVEMEDVEIPNTEAFGL